MKISFYNVKKRKNVAISLDDIEKVKYESNTKNGKTIVRFALKAVDNDGTKLTKFCSEYDWRTLL